MVDHRQTCKHKARRAHGGCHLRRHHSYLRKHIFPPSLCPLLPEAHPPPTLSALGKGGGGVRRGNAQCPVDGNCRQCGGRRAKPLDKARGPEFADSNVNFAFRPWVLTAQYWDIYFDIMEKIKLRLDEKGIEIPFPQRDIHLYQAGEDTAA